ncbi:type II toxin-antitoxin system YhaV family toxin [Pseudoxanthomonas mexicana]
MVSGIGSKVFLPWNATLRAYGSRTDAYVTFKKMLESGRPPDDWKALRAAVIVDAQRDALVTQMNELRERP